MKFVLKNPAGGMTHKAIKHPEYTDHYVTDCGMVVTTSRTRHETDLTGFIILDQDDDITCERCKSHP